MTLAVVFRPEAQDDALVVRDWYEERQANLGAEFVAQLSANTLSVGSDASELRVASPGLEPGRL